MVNETGEKDYLRNRLDAVIVRRIMEVFNGKFTFGNLSLHSGHHAVHFLHQMTDGIAHLLEAILTPPLGLVSIQTTTSTFVKNIAGSTRLANTL